MADDSKSERLKELYNNLSKLYELTQRLGGIEDSVCQDGKRLFRPWPAIRSDALSIKHQATNLCDEGSRSEQSSVNNTPDIINVEEREVSIVDKALAKAENMRRKALKQQELEHAESQRKQGTSLRTGGKDNVAQHIKPLQDSELKPTKHKERRVTLTGARRNGMEIKSISSAGPKPGVISHSQLEKLIGSTEHQTAKDKGKAKRNYMAAHVRAPYKTDLKSSRKPVAMKLLPGRPQSSGTKHIKVKSAPVRGSLHIVSKQVDSSQKGTVSLARRNTSNAADVDLQSTLQVKDTGLSGQIQAKTPQDHSVPCNVPCQSAVEHSCVNVHNKCGVHSPKPAETDEMPDEEFSLLKHGQTLTIPAKLSKTIANNRRLREKLKRSCLVVKVQEFQSAADEFSHRMEAFLTSELSKYEANALSKMKQYVDKYSKLSVMLENVHSMDVNSSSCWEEVLKAKRMMELILLNYAEMEPAYRKLEKELNQLMSKEKTGSSSLQSVMQPNPHLWISNEFLHCSPFKASFSSVIKYQHRRQLVKYLRLLHQYQLLLLEKHKLQELAPHLVSILGDLKLDCRNYYQVYRGVYALVCSQGHTFPSIVQDNIDELEANDEEQDGGDCNDF